jgi:hypothetical protein
MLVTMSLSCLLMSHWSSMHHFRPDQVALLHLHPPLRPRLHFILQEDLVATSMRQPLLLSLPHRETLLWVAWVAWVA